jgi:hypothetical protein
MKKLLAALLAGILLCLTPCVAVTNGDEDISQYIHIKYAMYDGLELFGDVEIPDGDFYIRATFFLPGDQYFVLIVPISREGLFQAYIAVCCESATIAVVDRPSAIVPGCGIWYLSAPVTMI